MGEKDCPVILPTWRLYSLLHAADLHGTDGFTSPPRRAEDFFARLPLYGAGIKEAVALYKHHTSYGVWFS
jgi:hypothetical protein